MIDLHMHTNYSDGTDSVQELLIKAENKKLDIISITDHDCVDVYYDLEKDEIRNLFSGKIIIGAELKTHYNGISMEVLGYGIDYKKIKIKKTNLYDLQVKTLEESKKRAKKLGLVFAENINVSKTDPKRKFASFTLAEELLKYKENKPIILSIGPMFDTASFYRIHTSNKNSIFYYDESKDSIPLEEAINIIHDAGGIAILAHPLVYPYDGKNKLEEIDKILENYDLDGLECEYPLFNDDERNALKKLAIKHNKYMTGGTDYHAKSKPNIEMGTGINDNMNISKELISNWVDKVKII